MVILNMQMFWYHCLKRTEFRWARTTLALLWNPVVAGTSVTLSRACWRWELLLFHYFILVSCIIASHVFHQIEELNKHGCGCVELWCVNIMQVWLHSVVLLFNHCALLLPYTTTRRPWRRTSSTKCTCRATPPPPSSVWWVCCTRQWCASVRICLTR